MSALPVLFRTIRRKSPDEEDLEKLTVSIKRQNSSCSRVVVLPFLLTHKVNPLILLPE